MHPVAGALAGKTYADNVRHANVRVHFMNALLTDSRVARLFDEWGQQTELFAAADALAQPIQQLAEAVGEPHWTAIGEQSGETDGQPFAAVGALLTALAKANLSAPAVAGLKSFCDELENFALVFKRNQPLEPSPTVFVRETLGLHWCWLALELVDCWYRRLQARAFGFVEQRTYTVVFESPLAPPLTWSAPNFETSAGETVEEAWGRLVDAATEAFRGLREVERALDNAHRKALGRLPKDDTRYLQDWAQWFYRVRVKEPPESERSVAIDADRDRRTIRTAVRNAERLLSLGSYTLRK